MNEISFFEQIFFIAGVATILYGVPYLVRLGWNHAENRTRKVCNVCFRDIKMFNDKLNKPND